MLPIFRKLAVLTAPILVSGLLLPATATTISGSLTADNAFFLYISTSDSVLGTLVTQGNDWGSAVSFSNVALTPGVTNYLHIEAINYGGPGGFIGGFTLSDTGFQFANNTQTLVTETSDWTGAYNSSNDAVTAQPWVTPSEGVVPIGGYGVGPWGDVAGIDPDATWIWPNDANSFPGGACGSCTVDFSAAILSSNPSVPEPGTTGLLGTALAGVGAILFRRRRIAR